MYINVIVILENTKLAELGVSDEILSPLRVKATSIDAYRNYVNDDGDVVNDEVMLYMDNGVSFPVKHTLEEIDEKIKKN